MSGEFELLSSDTVAELQALQESNLPHVALSIVIETSTGARTGGALDDPTPTTLASNVACRLTTRSMPSMMLDASQRRSLPIWLLVFARDTIVPPNAVVTVQGRDRDEQPWTRTVRVIDTLRVRAFTSAALYHCVDAGPAAGRVD